MTIPRIPYVVEGEIISVQKRRDGESNSILYTCRAILPNGSLSEIPNVEQASFLGGIGDYFRRRARARSDAEYPQNSFQQTHLDASVGERVYIAFIGGSMYHAVIIGYKQHPRQVDEFENPKQEDPHSVFQYLGVREVIDEKGQWRFTRKGAPEVNFTPQAQSALGGQSGETFDGDDSTALTPQGTDQRLVVEVLENALYRVRDPSGGMFELDHAGQKDGVFISDNDWKSTEDTDESLSPESGGLRFDENATDAEYLWLNRERGLVLINARKIAQIYSFDRRRDVTEGNHVQDVGGNSTWNIGGNKLINVSGDVEEFVEGDKVLDVTGSYFVSITSDLEFEVLGVADIFSTGDMVMSTDANMTLYSSSGYELKTDGNFSVSAESGDVDIVASGGAALKLSGGQVALGSGAAELLDLFEQTLTQMDTLLTNMQSETHTGNMGFPTSPPINAASYAAVQTQLATINTLLTSIKGSL